MTNGSEPLYRHALSTEASRRLTIPGVGLIEIITKEDGEREVVTNEVLSPEQRLKLDQWLEVEWPRRTS